MNKNDIIELDITDISSDGNGVGRVDGMVVFVPNTAVGDKILCRIVKVTKSVLFGRAEEILIPSATRCDTRCAAFPQCGGCDFRQFSYEEELRLKSQFVKSAFSRIGKINIEPEPIISGLESGYRNKAIYPVNKVNGLAVYGFYAARSHRVIESDICLLQPPVFAEIAEFIVGFLNEKNISVYDENTHNGLFRNIYIRQGRLSGEIVVTLVVKNRKFSESIELAERLMDRFSSAGLVGVLLNINPDDTNVVLSNKYITLAGREYILDTLCGIKLKISPGAFYQVNSVVAAKLYETAMEHAEPDGKNIFELYCGIGAIGLSAAKRAKTVTGLEVVPSAVANAAENAELNNITNTQFFCGDAEDAESILAEVNIMPDVVLVDPPRKGLTSRLIEAICGVYSPERVVYISCDAATLARDCAMFKECGYDVKKVTPVDMFPRTRHVETIALLAKQNT